MLTAKWIDRYASLLSRYLLGCLVLFTVSACANLSGPEYKRPETASKAQWMRGQGELSVDKVITSEWWTSFGDEYLNTLIDRALAANHDLKILFGRVTVAVAAVGEEKALRWPSLQGNAGKDLDRGFGSLHEPYSMTATLNWELDIWGKIQKRIDAGKAAEAALDADWRAGYLKLVAEVASLYFQLRQYDEQIFATEQYLQQNQHILTIYEHRSAEGLITTHQELKQKAEINDINISLLELKRRRSLAENHLATLLGVPAGDFLVPVVSLRQAVRIPEVPAGLPSDLLSRRPDIIAAEYRVLQAHNLAGHAKLARLPSLSLTARGGVSSRVLNALLKSSTFGLAPAINIPIFDPEIRAKIKSSKANAQLKESEYRKTVMVAFEEVENALVNLRSHKAQKSELQQQRQRLQLLQDQVIGRLKEGLVSQLELLESERTLIKSELELLSNYHSMLIDTVTLYKALGGGWPNQQLGAS